MPKAWCINYHKHEFILLIVSMVYNYQRNKIMLTVHTPLQLISYSIAGIQQSCQEIKPYIAPLIVVCYFQVFSFSTFGLIHASK